MESGGGGIHSRARVVTGRRCPPGHLEHTTGELLVPVGFREAATGSGDSTSQPPMVLQQLDVIRGPSPHRRATPDPPREAPWCHAQSMLSPRHSCQSVVHLPQRLFEVIVAQLLEVQRYGGRGNARAEVPRIVSCVR